MKKEKGFTGVDIVISIFVITIFVSVIGNIIVNINSNNKKIERNSFATIYAIQEIEKIKAKQYEEEYENKGLSSKEIILEEDIYEKEKFSGYHKTIYIEDYIKIKEDTSKQANVLKQITVEISYLLGSKKQIVQLSTCIIKE